MRAALSAGVACKRSLPRYHVQDFSRRLLPRCYPSSAAELTVHRRAILLASGYPALAAAAQSTAPLAQPQEAAMGTNSTKPSAEALQAAVKAIVPKLTGDRAKGQAGKIAVIGGCREYTGAPYFAAISALKIGADLSHVFCTEGAATVIKSYSPELIVHPYLPDSNDASPDDNATRIKRAVGLMDHWMDRFDAVVVGPGLGRDELVHDTVKKVITRLREKQKLLIIDADGLYITTKELNLIKGYELAVLTPNKHEFERLAGELHVPLEGQSKEAEGDPLLKVASALKGPVIVRKGAEDRICDGTVTISNAEAGSKRRAGGQGDVLSGSLAVMVSWALEHVRGGGQSPPAGLSPLVLAAYGGSLVARHAQKAAFEKKRRAMLAGDVIDQLGDTVDRLFEQSS